MEVLDNECFCDHYPIILKSNSGIKGDLSSYSYRDMSFLTKENIMKDFLFSLKHNLEDENLISDNNIDLAYKKFNHSLMKSLNFFAPLRNMIHKSKTNAPWFAKGLKNSCIKRNAYTNCGSQTI